MKIRRKKTKRNINGYIIAILTIVTLFLVIPRIIISRAEKLLDKELKNETDPPSNDYYIAMNYLKVAEVFPGSGERTNDIITNTQLRISGRFTLECMEIKDRIIDLKINKYRSERDSIINQMIEGNKWTIELETEISAKYDSLEDDLFESEWLEHLSQSDKDNFCQKWIQFFETTELKISESCDICK